MFEFKLLTAVILNFWEAPYQNNFQILVSVFFFFTMKRLVPNSSCEHRRVENQNLK